MTEILTIESIVSDPQVRGGQPLVAGTGVTVADLAAATRFQGLTPAQLTERFTLTLAEVHAALAYYYAHQSAIDALIRAERDRAEALRDRQQRRAWIETLKPPIAAFCQRWQIVEFALFGSVLTEDFRPDSDIDVLVTFAPGAGISLFDFSHMEDELKAIFGRDVDLVERRGVEQSTNPHRRQSILESAEVLHAA
jgi:predicted nucleotidyltransferase/uncharacterized protein (DUF433 family)